MTEALDDLTALRLALVKNGYHPVPVAGAHLNMKGAGKRPLLKAWETVCASASEDEVRRWTKALRNCTNTGLLCGELIGVDIDVLDADLAKTITDLAITHLGETSAIRIGRAPKTLLVYRSDSHFEKIQTAEFIFTQDDVARVEILAKGQQFVGYGVHPTTNQNYEWPKSSLADIKFDDMPVITSVACKTFIRAAEAALRDAGGKTRQDLKRIDEDGRKLAGLRKNRKPTNDLIEEAFEYIENNNLPYDEWVRIGLALYATVGPNGRDLWCEWSAQSTKNDPELTISKWESFAKVRSIGVGTLFYIARQNGWRDMKAVRLRKPDHTIDNDGSDHDNDHYANDNGDHDLDDQFEYQLEQQGARSSYDSRPTIKMHAGHLHESVTMGEGALIMKNLGFYQRGSLVVRPSLSPIAIADGKEVSAQRLVQVKAHHMAEALNKAASWMSYDMRNENWKKVDCPQRLAETYLAREGQWRLPTLTGIINCPTLRADGSILSEPGYDRLTGLLFDPQGVEFTTIPDRPDRSEARAALAYLKEPLSQFPFVAPEDLSVALSGILTVLIRRSISTAPLHGFNAPSAGTGKSMLVDIASLIATGRPASVIAQGKTEEEMEKRLGAALIAGDTLISVDNCEAPLGGELLCQALTQTSLKIRILGKSQNAEVPSNAAIFATGNNLVLSGDMTRRALRATLDSGVERPELRTFSFDPLQMIADQRGNYAAAALTILRAYHVAGRPEQVSPLGSFGEWSRFVRDALIWVGEADPCTTMENLRAADPKLESFSAIVTGWNEVIGNQKCTMRELIEQASRREINGTGQFEYFHPEFREALLGVAGNSGVINGVRLGKWISLHLNRPISGKKIIAAGTSSGNKRYQLVTASAQYEPEYPTAHADTQAPTPAHYYLDELSIDDELIH